MKFRSSWRPLLEELLFLEVLEKDFINGHSIKVLLKKLDVPDAYVEVVDFLVTFGPLFEQILIDFQRKHDS